MKKILTIALMALALAGGIVAFKNRLAHKPFVKETAGAPANPREMSAQASMPDDGIVVTYFTTDVRCPTCHKIEELARKAIELHFSGQLATGRMVFRTVNTDQPENRHFVDDYSLVSKTVIVSDRKGGKEAQWINLQDVWLKVHDEPAFDAYVSDAIRKYLDGRS
ncbi:MAG: hypothetical protein BGO12_20860 [Verrucomicrobia bacterium 61-8]|nr:hypothetical protein [Verrucomicrobiota bacterium]OJV03188.1 MAG: hypothetical protein BGO12_20860 [Verrucomicrobia bacterium 61-8]